MTSKATDDFWSCLDALPAEVQSRARAKYRLWQADPFHPSLHFKPIGGDLWSVRISLEYRALARRSGELIVWFWIGTHDEYEYLLDNL